MRMLELRKFIIMLDEMSVLIRFRATRTRDLIDELSKQENLSNFVFLNLLTDFMDMEDDINISWKTAASRTLFLTRSDKDILIGVGEQIGSTDVDGQLSMLELSRMLAEKNLNQAEDEYRTKGRMLRTVWMLCGLAAGIMVI